MPVALDPYQLITSVGWRTGPPAWLRGSISFGAENGYIRWSVPASHNNPGGAYFQYTSLLADGSGTTAPNNIIYGQQLYFAGADVGYIQADNTTISATPSLINNQDTVRGFTASGNDLGNFNGLRNLPTISPLPGGNIEILDRDFSLNLNHSYCDPMGSSIANDIPLGVWRRILGIAGGYWEPRQTTSVTGYYKQIVWLDTTTEYKPPD